MSSSSIEAAAYIQVPATPFYTIFYAKNDFDKYCSRYEVISIISTEFWKLDA